MARLNHQRAARLANAATDNRIPELRTRRNRPGKSARAAVRAQGARQEFVDRHSIGCFKCGAKKAPWAKTGVNRRGAWAICMDCVRKRGDATTTSG